MSTVLQFRKQAEKYHHTTFQVWVTAYVSDLKGLNQESLVYVGCSKKITPPGSMSWYCRKRLLVGEEGLPDENVNHNHVHDGECCSLEKGIPCYALNVHVSDHSGSIEAEVWAPSMHLLGMRPSTWLGLDEKSRNEVMSVACKWPFEMLLMSISKRGLLSHFIVHFVKPAAYHPNLVGLGELSTKFETISVVDDEDEHSVCTAGVQFAAPARSPPISDKLKEAIALLFEANEKNEKANSLLQSIMYDLF